MFNYNPRSNVSSEYIQSPMPPENTSSSREMLAHGTITPDIESPMNEDTARVRSVPDERQSLQEREVYDMD